MRFVLFLALSVVLAGGAVFGALSGFNHFRDIERDFDGRCTPVTGIDGPEDIKIDPGARRAFVSSLNRRDPAARGAIYAFDIANPLAQSGWRDRTNGAPEAFQPLGLSYFEADGVRRLFVVNEATSSVELFDVELNGGLVHLETLTERRVTSPNNIAAVGPRSFYVTNDSRSGRSGVMANLQFLMRHGSGQVLFYDGVSWRVVAEGLRFANGVEVSPDGERLYVAETSGQSVRLYDRDRDTGTLAQSSRISLPASPDNLNADPGGDIWVGALPKPLLTPRLAADPDAQAPSQVFRLRSSGFLESAYLDPGGEISASTAAARLDDTLLIGSLFEKKFLICELPDTQD